MKNITDKNTKMIKPSALIVVAKETNTNEKYINFLLELRNKTKLIVINNKKIGSVSPKNEFIINLGSKAISVAPIIANFFATNFLHKKYTGIVIRIEINTESIF